MKSKVLSLVYEVLKDLLCLFSLSPVVWCFAFNVSVPVICLCMKHLLSPSNWPATCPPLFSIQLRGHLYQRALCDLSRLACTSHRPGISWILVNHHKRTLYSLNVGTLSYWSLDSQRLSQCLAQTQRQWMDEQRKESFRTLVSSLGLLSLWWVLKPYWVRILELFSSSLWDSQLLRIPPIL